VEDRRRKRPAVMAWKLNSLHCETPVPSSVSCVSDRDLVSSGDSEWPSQYTPGGRESSVFTYRASLRQRSSARSAQGHCTWSTDRPAAIHGGIEFLNVDLFIVNLRFEQRQKAGWKHRHRDCATDATPVIVPTLHPNLTANSVRSSSRGCALQWALRSRPILVQSDLGLDSPWSRNCLLRRSSPY
jgi:hypothetical protein